MGTKSISSGFKVACDFLEEGHGTACEEIMIPGFPLPEIANSSLWLLYHILRVNPSLLEVEGTVAVI